MRKPTIDYKSFRFSKITEPKYRHLLYLVAWPAYFLMFFLTEKMIPVEKCFSVHCALDDMIPFCELFVIPYVGWYLLTAGSLLFFALYNSNNFKCLMKFIITTQIVAMVIYIVFPNRQDLRPAVFERDNVFVDCVKFLYSLDTNTNVCPSLHVAFSVGIASTWLKEKSASPLLKLFILVFCIAVCLSVVFIKQHSSVDVFAAVPVCVLAEIIAFGKTYWLNVLKKPLYK